MQAFLVGLQFLTRLSFVRQTEWDIADFGKSVKFFPLNGAVLGSIYAFAAYFLYFYSMNILWLLIYKEMQLFKSFKKDGFAKIPSSELRGIFRH